MDGYGMGIEEPAPSVSLVGAMAAILRFRRLVVGAGVALALLTGVVVLLLPRTYTASASFTPQASKSVLGGLGGVAAQFGLALPLSDGNQSPAFYADLLHSRTVLEPLVSQAIEFTWKGQAHRGTFVNFARIRDADSARAREKAMEALEQVMRVTVSARTNIVRVETTTRYPELSLRLTESALALLNNFNVETRRSQATAQRQFLERRLTEVSQELVDAEDAARDFAKRNRASLATSPELALQQERLTRAVSQREEVYSGLVQALEQAKLDEIRDTPLLTITELPELPARPDRRGLVIATLIAMVMGCFVGAVVAVVRYALERQRRTDPVVFAELAGNLAAAKADVRRLMGPLSRGRRPDTD